MHLKRLEIQGFKSFADKTVLDFKNGVTAVVGPNGSGKSNISDAIRWVLGEMSAKTLRGSNMQDVIFSGTQSRKQLNFAEVSIVLDNSDNTFPIEFDEVVVTRRVFRSGESVYQINRANCRLKDIHELFMDTGLGRDGYSIIGQGNVAQILSTKAEDRRSIFEEAAGISKYRHKKEEACRKLDGVNENLVRITDYLATLEERIGPLEKQSEKARQYLILYEQFKKLDVNLILLNLEKNKADKAKADALFESVIAELTDVQSQGGAIERELDELYEQTRKCDDEQTEKNRELLRNNEKGVEIRGEISVAKTNIENNIRAADGFDRDIADILQRNEQHRKRIAESEQERAATQALIDEMETVFAEEQSQADELSGRLDKTRELLDSKRADVIELMNSVAAEKAQQSGMDATRSSIIKRREEIEAEISGYNAGAKDTEEKIAGTNEAIAETTEKRDKMSARIEKQRVIRSESEARQNAILSELNAMTVEYNSKTSKKRMLEDMENGYEGYARSVKAVLTAPELKKISIMGTLSSLVEVKSEYVTAVETALGGALQNIVVESEEDAKAAIEYLRHTKAGRATFLPVSSVNGRVLENRAEIAACDGFVGIASELVTYDKKYDGIVKSLLGRVAVFDNIDNGIKVSRKFGYRFRTVTLAGDVLNAGGSMSGGSTSKSGGFLSRANDIKQLAGEINALSRALTEKSEALESAKRDIAAAVSQLDLYEPMLRDYEDELITLSNNLSYLRASLEQSGTTQEQRKRELDEINVQLKASGEDVAQLISSIREKENTVNALNEEIKTLDEQLRAQAAEKEEKNKRVLDNTLRKNELESSIKAAMLNESNLADSIRDGEAQIEDKKQSKQRIFEENKRIETEISEKEAEAVKIDEVSAKLDEEIRAIGEKKNRIVERQKKIQESNKDLADRRGHLQGERSRAEAQQEKLENERESMINRMWDEYELTVSTAEELRIEIEDKKTAGEELNSLKGKIRGLGNVNMDSIEEYRTVKEEFEFKSEQKADLDKSKDNLNKIIDSMQELMEDNFARQFKVINESFASVFRDLFGGGSGEVYLTDPENALESGIEIKVQLPGKAMQNISLYSGGERSFIAVALLFAILNVKPTPFCILDEIDAALDDVNVARFATYLHNYTHAQFIVITHRRGTMEAADVMYGVTMQEKGVSKLLSLEIDDVDTNIGDELVM